MMGFARSFSWMNRNVCKKQCRSLFWRVRAAVKKSVKCHQNGGKKQATFHYDPSSYALNFDDGGGGGSGGFSSIGGVRRGEMIIHGNGGEKAIGDYVYYKLQFFIFLAANSTWVYVFFIRV